MFEFVFSAEVAWTGAALFVFVEVGIKPFHITIITELLVVAMELMTSLVALSFVTVAI